MSNPLHAEIRELVDRIARIGQAGEWEGDLNPTQRAALAYLSRANRFSRSPSHVADYLSATRGTVSQTLKALARKGYVEEVRSALDRRSISYKVTDKGLEATAFDTDIGAALAHYGETEAAELAAALKQLVARLIAVRGGRGFGTCRTCRHHRRNPTGLYCDLLKVDLKPHEADRICHEHRAA
ncbi:MAG: MarR family transcriptional regulator [Rhizobiaceae bacterium]